MTHNFVIKKRHLYASNGKTGKAYTTLLKNAQIYTSLDHAKRHKCGNERIVLLSNELPR